MLRFAPSSHPHPNLHPSREKGWKVADSSNKVVSLGKEGKRDSQGRPDCMRDLRQRCHLESDRKTQREVKSRLNRLYFLRIEYG
jgi:hypothetical protein